MNARWSRPSRRRLDWAPSGTRPTAPSTSQVRTGRGWQRLIAPLVDHWSTAVGSLIGLAALGAAVLGADGCSGPSCPRPADAVRGRLGRSLVILATLPWILRVRRALAQAVRTLCSPTPARTWPHICTTRCCNTLALIKRQASDRTKVAALARRQERELRQGCTARRRRPGAWSRR